MNVLSFKILRLNSSFNISCKSYASVGYCSDIEFDDRYFDLDVSSSVPEHCPWGGDSGTKTYNLTARKSGFTKAILTQYFRGNVKKRTVIRFIILWYYGKGNIGAPQVGLSPKIADFDLDMKQKNIQPILCKWLNINILASEAWSREWDSNPRPFRYEWNALPTELLRQLCRFRVQS